MLYGHYLDTRLDGPRGFPQHNLRGLSIWVGVKRDGGGLSPHKRSLCNPLIQSKELQDIPGPWNLIPSLPVRDLRGILYPQYVGDIFLC